MEIKTTRIQGVLEIYPKIFNDERGYFFESFNLAHLKEAGLDLNFVQDNQSFSKKGVVRGLHFQKPPYGQGKLVRVIKGRVIDIAVDLREGSETFGEHLMVELDDQSNNMLYVPEGFAHGFAALEDSVFFYKCTNYYHKASESGVLWNDKTLNINWGVNDPIVSEKDRLLPTFEGLKQTLLKGS